MMGICLFGCKSNNNESHWTWRELLETTGANLWYYRYDAFHTVQRNDLRSIRKSKELDRSKSLNSHVHWLDMGGKGGNAKVAVITETATFQEMETEYKMEKMPPTNERQPLTACVGEEWNIMRVQLLQALDQVPYKSLQALGHVLDGKQPTSSGPRHGLLLVEIEPSNLVSTMPTVPPNKSCTIDLKESVVRMSVLWITTLFRGIPSNPNDATSRFSLGSDPLAAAVMEYFRQTRARRKRPENIRLAANQLQESLLDLDGKEAHFENGLWFSFRKQLPTKEIARDNAVNAMMAALDAMQALVFWTLWNLSRKNDRWAKAQAAVVGCNTTDQDDLEILKQLKQDATKGMSISATTFNKLSFLGRALVETARVFPPVWTLPRASHCSGRCASTKVDVLAINMINGNSSTTGNPLEEWDPDRFLLKPNSCTEGKFFLATFGLGRRHCPAGTAALWTSYRLLREFCVHIKSISEVDPGRVIRSAHLSPTLSVDGPQLFYTSVETAESSTV